MAQSSDPLSKLLEFCSKANISVDSRLRIEYEEPEAKAIGVFLNMEGSGERDVGIPPNTTVVYIPKGSILSVKSTGLAKLLGNGYELAPWGIEAQLELAMALYIEEMKGTNSYWYLYLKSLPAKRVDLPMFWPVDIDEDEQSRSKDTRMALRWMKGTGIELHSSPLGLIDRFFSDTVSPTLYSNSLKPSLHAFYRCFSLVSSRAFLVDSYHGLAMVPVADAFNHIRENHVHLESEHHVCPECGSLRECEHDGSRRTKDPYTPRLQMDQEDELFYMMTTTTYIPDSRTRTEIYNTYGAHLSNPNLLNQYGFILDANEADFIEFSELELPRSGQLVEDPDGRLSSSTPSLVDSELLYQNDEWRINSDGCLSSALFCRLASASQVVRREDIENLQRALLEWEETGDAEADSNLGKVASFVVNICKSKLGRLTQDDVDTILDGTPPAHWRTRVVGLHVLTERAILQSCIANWVELVEGVENEANDEIRADHS